MRITQFLLLIGALAIFCSACKDSSTEPSQSSIERSVLEAAARNRIESYAWEKATGQARVYFLAFGEAKPWMIQWGQWQFTELHDPDFLFMLRFRDAEVPVEPYSWSTWPTRYVTQHIRDKRTGIEGRLFALSMPTIQANRAVVDETDFFGISEDLWKMYLSASNSVWRVDSVISYGSVN